MGLLASNTFQKEISVDIGFQKTTPARNKSEVTQEKRE